MARVYTSGFEINSTTAGQEWNTVGGASYSVTSTNARTGLCGNYSTSATTSTNRAHIFVSNQNAPCYFRAYLRIGTLPAANTFIMQNLSVANVANSSIRLNTDGTLTLHDSAGTQVGSASAALSTSTYYRIELKNDSTNATGTLDAMIDGVSFASGNNATRGQWGRVLVGVITSTTAVLQFDDIAVNDNTGSFQNSWPGSGKVIMLQPNGAGTSNQWLQTAGGAGSSTNYTLVNENPSNGATTLVQSNTLNNLDMYDVADAGLQSYDTVNVVEVGARGRNGTAADATTAFKVSIAKTSGGTRLDSAASIINSTTFSTNPGNTGTASTLVTYQDPDAGTWTNATVDSMQIGLLLSAANVNPINISTIWSFVDYTPGTPPGGQESNLMLMGMGS